MVFFRGQPSRRWKARAATTRQARRVYVLKGSRAGLFMPCGAWEVGPQSGSGCPAAGTLLWTWIL